MRCNKAGKASTLLSLEELENFTHEVRVTSCGLCNNHCRLTINVFGGNRRFIGGNRCEKPVTKRSNQSEQNMYAFKLETLRSYLPVEGPRGKLGFPMGLNMYELLPFWYTFFTKLGFEVVTSPLSSRELVYQGTAAPSQATRSASLPKLMHGHVDAA